MINILDEWLLIRIFYERIMVRNCGKGKGVCVGLFGNMGVNVW